MKKQRQWRQQAPIWAKLNVIVRQKDAKETISGTFRERNRVAENRAGRRLFKEYHFACFEL